MKRALFAAAAGALGALGTAGLMSAAPASAACEDPTPPLGPILCVVEEPTNEFLRTASPRYNLGVLVNGTTSGARCYGLRNQRQTFVDSIGDFSNGPRFFDQPAAPDPAPAPAPAPAP